MSRINQLFFYMCWALVFAFPFTSANPCFGQEGDPPTEQQEESADEDEDQDEDTQDEDTQDEDTQDEDTQDEDTQDEDADTQDADQEAEPKIEGQEDLDKAFDLKSNAENTRQLDEVCDLCKSAIDKGLEKDAEVQARELWAATLYETAEALSERIFPPNTDRRWRAYRRQAISRLDEAVEIQSESVDIFIMLARLRGMGGDDEEARKAIEKAVDLAGNEPGKLSKALVIRGSLSEDPAARLADFSQAVKIDPSNVDAIRSRAAQYLLMEKTDKAIDDFELWIEAEPENLNAYKGIVEALLFEERVDEAIEKLGEAIKIAPDSAEPYTMRARLHLQKEEFDEAFSDAEEALKIEKNDVQALMVRSSVFTNREKYQEALDDVNRALKVEPELIQGIWMRSILCGQLEDFDQAIADIQVLIRNAPQQTQFKTQLAMLYNAADRPEDAVKIYDDLIEDDTEDVEALRGRGDAYLSLSKHQEAVADYNEALKIDSESDGILNNLAWVLATSPFEGVRDGKRAIELATKAGELTQWKEAHVLSTLASGYAEAGDFEKAVEWVGKALKISDDDDQRESLGKELESYQSEKPWREDQLKELEEKREKAGDESDDSKDESDESKSDGDEEKSDDDEGKSDAEKDDDCK